MPGAYYNEIDPYAAQWLRNLIAAGHIAPGDVDERDIRDVRPDDLRGYTQCHFFAGIGVWSYALRRAGWPDDMHVWTGSCPCQPFSVAGLGGGFNDERHLWPFWHFLIEQRRPAVVLGEQVASKDADVWVDLVQDDMEVLDYAFGALPFPAASVTAPNIRDRLYWVAHTHHQRLEGWGRVSQRSSECPVGQGCMAGGVADADTYGCHPAPCGRLHDNEHYPQPCCRPSWLADANGVVGDQGRAIDGRRNQGSDAIARSRSGGDGGACEGWTSPLAGFWRDADWLLCRDGKWRPVEPGSFPLVDGDTERVGRLRAYGNAINAEQARLWCEIVRERLQ